MIKIILLRKTKDVVSSKLVNFSYNTLLQNLLFKEMLEHIFLLPQINRNIIKKYSLNKIIVKK